MSHRSKNQTRSWKERAMSLVLAAVLLLGTVPGLTLPASAHWADEYLDKMVDWGVMRADQTRNPDTPVTRAEFAGVINRAYGYTETGPIPFEDVDVADWFYDDICIAYTAGYMAGTSPTTASPNDTLTREMAVCILGRNMMMKETPGESLAFTDSRDISSWAHGMIKTAVDNYVISGYPDNSFGPHDAISRAQMAVLVSQCVGSPVSESGTYELGGVFGNVTITAPNVTLRNTTVSGDLYISGGVGLGGIKLENVNVLGRIIVSGTGESEAGDASVIMRNVTASEMLVDNMRNKTVTVRADGITDIAKTVVRTNAYLEDNNTDDKGLMSIELDGESGTRLTLAGRIKEVVDKTPNSYIQVGKGTVAKLTVDEAAVNSTVQLDRNTEVKEMNLDVATNVTGEGDIGKLNINAPGSVVAMLPDEIYIRPGLTASIAGVIMDHQAAEEGSLDPRLLSGYPAAKDIAPTGFRADFAGNKKGTVYWAVSYVSDGSINEENLISPPSYGSRAIANGSVAAPSGGDTISAQVANLTVGGSYYLSAILVDEAGNRSAVKVISFSTPDNTVPAFGQGYPYMSRVTRDVAQVTVMPTKSCKLYYALLPQGAQAPTAENLKAAAVTGNLGYGVRDVTKNTEDVFTVNSQRLEELKNYVLYLWLTDVDGANSSAVQSLAFTIPDETPPVVDPVPYSVSQGTTGNTIAMRSGMNERGTIYWAVVPHGEPYPLPNLQSDPLDKDNVMNENDEAVSAKLNTDYAKLGVTSGRGALVSGSVAVGTPDAEVSFNVTGLLPEMAYDLYYVGRDTAGNYSEEVKMVTVNTLDTAGPIVSLYFINPDRSTCEEMPPANASIVLDFTERITVDGTTDLVTMNGTQNLAEKLQANFILYYRDPMNPGRAFPITGDSSMDVTGMSDADKEAVKTTAKNNSLTWIDYDKVVVRESSTNQGHIEVVFPAGEAISMISGRTYYFSLNGIKDTSGNYPPGANNSEIKVPLTPSNTANTDHVLPEFTTAFASVSLSDRGTAPQPVWVDKGQSNQGKVDGGTRVVNGTPYDLARMDTFFTVSPESTEGMTDETCYDIFLFADQSVSYDLYYRIVDTTASNKVLSSSDEKFVKYKLPSDNTPLAAETNGWIYLGNYESIMDRRTGLAASAVNRKLVDSTNFPSLNKLGEGLRYEFTISVTSKDGDNRYAAWNGTVSFDVYIMGGSGRNLNNGMNGSYTPESLVAEWSLQSIGIPNPPGYITIKAPFSDSIEPVFVNRSPSFVENVTSATLNFELNPTGSTLYYRIAPVSEPIPTKIRVLKSVGNISADTELDVTVQSERDKFYEVIKAQTDSGDGRGQLSADDQLEYYEVIEENNTLRKAIANMNNSYPNNFPGSDVYTYTNGQKPLRIPSADSAQQLAPNTEYYIYMVLESASGNQNSLSQVYIYTFRTSETAKPRIEYLFDKNDGTVDIGTSVASKVSYMMFPQAKLSEISVLSDPFTDADKLPSPYNTSVTSVLDALTTQYSYRTAYPTGDANAKYDSTYDGYTIFDLYATDAEKIAVDRMVRDRVGLRVNPVKYELDQDTPDSPGFRNFDWFTDNPNVTTSPDAPPQYILVAIAHNIASNTDDRNVLPTIDSFRAIKDVYKTDATAPVLETVQATVTNPNDAGRWGVKITLGFNKALYTTSGAGSAPKDVTDISEGHRATATIGSISSTASASAHMNHDLQARMTIGSVTLLANETICDSTGSGTTANKVIITLSTYTVPSDSGAPLQLPRLTVQFGEKLWQWDNNVLVTSPR